MNLESVQDKTRESDGRSRPALVRSFQMEASAQACYHCGTLNQAGMERCGVCGSELVGDDLWKISLKDTLLFFALLLLVALTIAPVWSSDQIYGKAIFFLHRLGVYLPGSLSEAAHYRSLVTSVIDIYHSLNLIYYLTIALITFLFVINYVRVKRGAAGFPRKTWMILGIALLVFPLTNLAISWSMFFTPGVIGTAIAAFIILFAGIIDPRN